MKKMLLVCLMFAACGKETPVAPSSKPAAPAMKAPTVAPTAQPPVIAKPSVGDYGKALDWVRSAPAFHFDIKLGDVNASGDLVRARVGEERVRFKAGGEEWSAERNFRGVSWSRNGKKDTNEPPYADRIYQWITLFPEPPKSSLQVVGTEGDANHVRYTNLNTKETNDLWIRNADNHLLRFQTSGAGKAFPPVEITLGEAK